jgi:Peptidase family M28
MFGIATIDLRQARSQARVRILPLTVESTMPTQGWKQLLAGWPWFRGEGSYPISAYSEFMPSPPLVRKPYGTYDLLLFDDKDPWGWPVTEYDEALSLRPGLEKIAHHVLGALIRLGQGHPAHGIARGKLENNPYWPPELAHESHKRTHERYVSLLPLALSRTQDDKGRVGWTLFGGSEQGPSRAFWKSFYTAPGRELPEEQALAYLRRLLHTVYREPLDKLGDLRRAGFRILSIDDDLPYTFWRDEPLPSWTDNYRLRSGESLGKVKYLLTFRSFGSLPAAVRRAYLASELHLIPFPGSLLFWGVPAYHKLQRELELAVQLPLLHLLPRVRIPQGIRVPQSGWMHEPHPDHPEPSDHHGPVRNTVRRTHRWGRVHRDEDELAIEGREDKVLHVLFSTASNDLGLYDKPMARNAQIWSHDFRLLLDGPRATREQIHRAAHEVLQGGLFGYRFVFPAMRVGRHELYWHRPLVAFASAETGEPTLLPDAPAGYLTAYRPDAYDLAQPIELWPRFLEREAHVDAVRLFENVPDPRPHQTTINVRKLLDTRDLMGCSSPRSLVRALLTLPKKESVDTWLDSLAERAADHERGRHLVEKLQTCLQPAPRKKSAAASLTFTRTARRSFEVAYWKTIAFLAEGKYLNKNNADVVRDAPTEKAVRHHYRDLDKLGDYLLDYYTGVVARAGMSGKALVGDLPFTWQTDFDFSLYGGWLNNQEGVSHERDLIVVIPGRDRSRAVIMGDHYDTAYMEDSYEKAEGGDGARVAAAGADDNHSATATLMLGAPIFLQLSRARKLACDIWLIHLTGEEFPADCLGARFLSQQLVQGTLTMRQTDGKTHDLSRTKVQGVYVLDMVAHNNDHDRDVFQIAPGANRESMWLATQAHLANEAWNVGTAAWNRRSSRRHCGRCRRSTKGSRIPAIAAHPSLRGEVRPYYDPRSTLYNTDGQIFSDAGVPVVLFMENYDINRSGYHDSHDTMENIDLDYGAGVAAIAIESVARAATEKPPI